MIQFNDEQGCLVEYSQKAEFGEAWHVLVLCHFQGQWVLTRHRIRGLEFPGGKREKSETIEEAAIREVNEETGGIVGELQFLGQYKVHRPDKPFVKSIYYAEIIEMELKSDYLETAGPVLREMLPTNIKNDLEFSFIMKDEVLPLSLQQLDKKRGTSWRG